MARTYFCEWCGQPKECLEQEFETVDSEGYCYWKIGHICQECLDQIKE